MSSPTTTIPVAIRRSRPQRWRDAVAELVSLQDEYRAWLDSLPDNLAESATAAPGLARPDA